MANKYNAQKATRDGHQFDSKAEATRYGELAVLQRAGEISGLHIHPRFELQPPFTDRNGKSQQAITYTADFSYREDGQFVVEDVKGGRATQTALFRVKARMLMYQRPDIDFRVVVR